MTKENSQAIRPVPRVAGGLMHLQFVDWRRLKAKQAHYQLVEVLRFSNTQPRERIRKRYSRAVDETGLKTLPVPREWWGPEKGLLRPGLEPWQEAEARRLVVKHGRQFFHDLDLFGVA